MKKFIALLLSFIMVFTMIPPIVGPAALADDNLTGAPPLESWFDSDPIIDDDFEADDGEGGTITVHYHLYFDNVGRRSRLDEWFDGVYNDTYYNRQNIPIVSFNELYPTKYFYCNGVHGLPVDEGPIRAYVNDMDPGNALNDRDVFDPDSLTCPDGYHNTSERYIGTMPEEEKLTLPEITHTDLKLPEVDVYRKAKFVGWKPYDSSMPKYTANMAVSDFMTTVGIVLLIIDPPTTAIGAISGILSAGLAISDRVASLTTSGGDEDCITIATYRYTYRIVIDDCVEYTVVKDVDYKHGGKDDVTGEYFYRYSIYFPTLPEYPLLPDGSSGSISLQALIGYDICENPWSSYYGHANDPEIAISWGVIDALRYAYTHNGYHNCIDEDHDTWCDYCGVHVHTYTNCADTTCNDVGCDYERDMPGYPEADGHVYHDCYDLTCERCGFERAEPHHAMSTPIWEIVGAPDICKIYSKFCTRTGCGYIEAIETDTSHDYSDCASACSVCDHSRGEITGYVLGGHVYSDCLDLTCDRCDYSRPSAYHTMSTPVWEIVGSPDICKIYTHFCTRTGCGYIENISTDTSHDYSDCADDICSICDHSRGSVPGYLQNGHVYSDYCTDTTCNRAGCGHVRTANHDYSDCADSVCNICDLNRGTVSGYLQSGHVYSDYCTDTTCNRTGCGHVRTAPGHSMSTPAWEIVGSPDICRINTHFCTNTACSYTETLSTDTSHDYSNCSDNVCGVCDHNRGSVSGYLQSGHVYSNYCTDTTCNRTGCGHVRTAPGHSMSTPIWEIVGSPGICRINTHYCTRTGCSYTETISTDTSHDFSNCADSVCGVCDHNRGSVSGYLQSGHMYNDYCTDTTCNRSGCGYVRTAPGHSMSTPIWEIVGSSGICRIYTHFCTRTGCSYIENISTDTSHSYSSWTYSSSSQHKRTCSLCDYVQYASHSYPSSWVSYSSSQHRHACTGCGHYVYANHNFSSWTNYSSTQHRRKCSTCGYYAYGSHNWVYTGSGSIYYCSVCGATRS